MHAQRTVFAAGVLVAAVLAGLVVPTWGSAQAGTGSDGTGAPGTGENTAMARLELPGPTGAHPVGRVTLDLRDQHRADPWVPRERRELMVSVWYPASRPIGRPAPFMTPAESALFLRDQRVTGVPPAILAATVTHSHVGAPPLPRPRALPLVVLSPGFGFPRSSLTGLGEDLASRGYVVAAVDHNYEAAGIAFPDGRVTECLACRQGVSGPAVASGRAEDVSFLLDLLTSPHPVWAGARIIDPRRIAMVGHSIGGASALATMLADRRVRFGADLDGTVHTSLSAPFDRPFMLLGAEEHGRPGEDPSWDATWDHLAGWRRWLTVNGTTHVSFTDFALLGEQIGITPQPLPGRRCLEITRAYVAAALDRHLRRGVGALLDSPSTHFPEVRIWRRSAAGRAGPAALSSGSPAPS